MCIAFNPSRPPSPTDSIGPASDFSHYFIKAAKPESLWAIGPEVELFGFSSDTLERIGLDQVQAVIKGFSPETVASETEDGLLIEATLAEPSGAHSRITIEPGGQIEFSGAHYTALSDVERSLRQYVKRLSEIGEANGIIFVAAGFDPLRSLEEQKWVPKQRYKIMRPYLASRGPRAWDMMARTAAIQVNLDYSDPDDLAKKFALANKLGPVVAAIFANSPLVEGKLSGYKSTRYGVWLETDPDRTGLSPASVEDEFSIERFIKHLSRVPMLFIRRDGKYIDMTGRSFTQFIANGAGRTAIFQDFTDHLSTVFTEARLKPHIEQRSMDCGSLERVMAALALWKGLMYDRGSLERALAIAPRLGRDDFARLQLEVARHGLAARLDRLSVIDLAVSLLEIARAGLDAIAPDEARYLDVLDEQVIKERLCPADILIRNFRGSWHADARKAVQYLRIAD
jgi:glutamate--cysteine ligase